MTKNEKKERLKLLKIKAKELKKEIDYNNALQLGLKLVLNGSYGAFAAKYFILFNNKVAGTITAEGRELTKTMSNDNENYWYNLWHKDDILHKKMKIKDVQKIDSSKSVSIYGDTDSIFVGFKPAIDSCEWKNNLFSEFLDKFPKKLLTINNDQYKTNNPNVENINIEDFDLKSEFLEKVKNVNHETIFVSGHLVKDSELNKILKDKKVFYNWKSELEFIQGLDRFRIEQYFKDCLNCHAKKYNVDNIQDFELEKISESMINLEKKKYIQHIVYEDGVSFRRLEYFQPKGVELVRSSTPVFARDKERGIPKILNYLFAHPDDFNIKTLMKIVRKMRREFELSDIDDISMQSSCSNYNEKILDDVNMVKYVDGAHFAVKAAAYHNFLLNKQVSLQNKYNFLKSGDKIKYYYTMNKDENKIFAFLRGSYPMEFAPEVNYDVQFEKAILSPVNSIIKKLGIPEISRRLSVFMGIMDL